MKINVNDMVTVKLTDRGRQVLKYRHDMASLQGYEYRFKGDEELITRPLWEIVALFGAAWGSGSRPEDMVFETTMELIQDSSPQLLRYAISTIATRKVETQTRIEFYASTNLVVRQVGSEDEAVGLGYRLARERWPLDEGWTNHQVTVCLAS